MRKFRWEDVLNSDDWDHHADGSGHTPDWGTLAIADDFRPAFDGLHIPLEVNCDLCGLNGRWSVDIEPMQGSEETIAWV